MRVKKHVFCMNLPYWVHCLLKGTVSPDFEGFFMTYDIKSVLSVWALMVFKFFHQMVILIF
jgi:hypothetical protein